MTALRIPVIVLTEGHTVEPMRGDATIELRPSIHSHADGKDCPACAAIGDVRVALYELLDAQRAGLHEPVRRVIVNAHLIGDIQPTLDRLTGAAPATAMRDHVVARAFKLTEVL